MLRWLICLLKMCPCKPTSDDKGCWGECTLCGKRVGYVTREEIRNYIEREEQP